MKSLVQNGPKTKSMIIVSLTILSSILSPLQQVSYINCMITVFDYFL